MQTLVNLSVQSLGLLPLMALVFLAAIMVILERMMFFVRSVRVGRHLVHDLSGLALNTPEAMKRLAAQYDGSLHGALVKRAIASRGKPEPALEREVDEEIMLQMPRL